VARLGKPGRISIATILALGVLLGACAFGVKIGSRYRTYRLLFELGKRDALLAATKVVLGVQKSYGEMQQDLWIVLSVMPGKRDGYYVDVGSADGVITSNTKLLDDMGWKGVCIDPFPTNMASRTCHVFRQPVFSVSGKKVSFRAATAMMGGISDTLGVGASAPNVIGAPIVELTTATLDEILEKAHAPRHIDFMSIDIEGAELEALRGLSFDKYQVEAFAIEHNFEQAKREGIRQLLESKGYTRVRSWAEDDWYLLHNRYKYKLDWSGTVRD
jgi:FkbM family methyltransferase